VAGSDSRRLCDSYLEDIASGRYTGVSLTGRDSTPLGDLDGDGYDDFGASLSAGVDVGEPAAYFFSASDVLRGEFTEDDAAGSVLAESGSEWGGIRAVSQGPGGVPGVLVDGAGLPGRTFIPLDHVPAPYEELPTKRLSMNLRDNYATFGDLDADGFADFPSSFDDDDAGVNDSYVLPGFDLDWDDDSLW
jgi:hypothetical protein